LIDLFLPLVPLYRKWITSWSHFSLHIQPHRYKKSLKSETTQNKYNHTIPRKHFVLWAKQIIRITLYNSFLCTQEHNTHPISLPARNFSSTLYNTIIGSFVGRNAYCFWIFKCVHHSWLCFFMKKMANTKHEKFCSVRNKGKWFR